MRNRQKQLASVFTDSLNKKLDDLPDNLEHTSPYKPVKDTSVDFVDLLGAEAFYGDTLNTKTQSTSSKRREGVFGFFAVFGILLCFSIFVYALWVFIFKQ